MKTVGVAVGTPVHGLWQNGTVNSLALMMCYFTLHRPEGYEGHYISLCTVEGSMVSEQRERIVRQCLREKRLTHLLFIDSDMKFPMNTVHRLLAHDKDFVAANCTTRNEPIVEVAHDLDGKRLPSRGKKGLQEIQHVGLAVALLRLEPLKRLRPPLFLQDWVPSLQTYCGEDVYFLQKLREVGLQLWIDHDLSQEVYHIGSRSYGHADVKDTPINNVLIPPSAKAA